MSPLLHVKRHPRGLRLWNEVAGIEVERIVVVWGIVGYFLLSFCVQVLGFSAVSDDDLFGWRGVEFAEIGDAVDYFEAFDDCSEDDVDVVKPGGVAESNVELTGVCVLLPTIRHSHQIPLIMLVLKTLIPKILPINTLPT
jgi:hypothetical protein